MFFNRFFLTLIISCPSFNHYLVTPHIYLRVHYGVTAGQAKNQTCIVNCTYHGSGLTKLASTNAFWNLILKNVSSFKTCDIGTYK